MSTFAVVVPPVALLPLAVAVLPPVTVYVPHVTMLPLDVVVPLVAVIVSRHHVAHRPHFASSSCH